MNDRSILRQECDSVTYVHILFDKHQVIYSEGLTTESFLPGPQTTNLVEQPLIDGICTVFPKLDPHSGDGYGPAVRPGLRKFKARALLAAGLAA